METDFPLGGLSSLLPVPLRCVNILTPSDVCRCCSGSSVNSLLCVRQNSSLWTLLSKGSSFLGIILADPKGPPWMHLMHQHHLGWGIVVRHDSFVTPWAAAHQAPLSMDFPGKNTEVGCHSLLQVIFPTQGSNLRLLQWWADPLPLSQGQVKL